VNTKGGEKFIHGGGEKFYRHGGGDNFGEQKLKNPKPKLIPALGRPSLGETKTPLCYCSRLPISLERSSLSLFEPPLSLSKQATTHSPSSSPSQGCPLPLPKKNEENQSHGKAPCSPDLPSPSTEREHKRDPAHSISFISGRHPAIGIFGSQNQKPHRGPLFPVEAAAPFPQVFPSVSSSLFSRPHRPGHKRSLNLFFPHTAPYLCQKKPAKATPTSTSNSGSQDLPSAQKPPIAFSRSPAPPDRGRPLLLSSQTEHGGSPRCLLPSLLPAPQQLLPNARLHPQLRPLASSTPPCRQYME